MNRRKKDNMPSKGKKNNSNSQSRSKGPKERDPRTRKVSIPAAVGGTVTLQARSISNIKDGVRVRFSDRMDNLMQDGTAFFKGYVNVGGAFTYFPWLSRIANNYSRFRVNSMRYYVASSCPTSVTGMVSMAYLPESTDVNNWFVAAESESIYQMAKSVTAPIWCGTGPQRDNPLTVNLSTSELHNMTKWLYTGAGVTISDYNTHYAGALVLQVSPHGGAGSVVRGQVFVEYDMDFVQPAAHLFNAYSSNSEPAFPEGGGGYVYPPMPHLPVPPPPPKPFEGEENDSLPKDN